jgi:hypothetical protein
MDLYAKFQQIYANLPLGARTEIVATIDGAPMTWNAVYIEVQQRTEKSKQILSFLEKIGVLK